MYASHKSVKEFPHLHEGFFSEHFQGESIANLEGGGFNPEKNLLQVKLPSDFFLPNFWGQHTSGRCFNLPPIRKPIIKYPHSHGNSTILMAFTRKDGGFQGYVSFFLGEYSIFIGVYIQVLYFFGGYFHFHQPYYLRSPETCWAATRQNIPWKSQSCTGYTTSQPIRSWEKRFKKNPSGSEKKSLFRPCLCQFLCKIVRSLSIKRGHHRTWDL